MQPLDLAAGLRVVGAGVSVGDPNRASSNSIAQRPPPPLPASTEAGNPWVAAARWNVATTSAALVMVRLPGPR